MTDKPQQTRLPELQFTQVPNLYFELMPVMSEPEMKVMGAAIRNIIGYHKTAPEPMAQSWFIKKTGLSRNAVKKGIIEAVDRGWLAVATDPTKFTSTEYVLVFEGGEVSRNDPRKEDRGSNRDPHEMTPQKKEVLKKDLDTTVSTAPQNKLQFSEYQQLVEDTFNVDGERVMNIYHILQGTSKRVGYRDYNITPAVAPDELTGFKAWYAKQNPGVSIPLSPEKIQHWILAYREWVAGGAQRPKTPLERAWDEALADQQRRASVS